MLNFFMKHNENIYAFLTISQHWNADIGKSTGPRSSTSENSGEPMKTLIVPILLSGKKFL